VTAEQVDRTLRIATGDKLARLRLDPDATLIEAMRTIDAGGCGIAIACDESGGAIGTLTDGDIRRAVLGGSTLDHRSVRDAMQPDFTWVGPDAGRAEVIDMMRARTISQVPVLDEEGRLVGLHLLQELIGATDRENWAVILAGGRGTRLRPLTDTVPKPMLRVAGRPILERIVLHLVGAGFQRIFLSVNHLAHVIEDHFQDGAKFGCQIDYLREQQPLGTGGPLSLLPKRPEHPLVLMNGDLVTQADIGELLDFHTEGGYAATVGVRPYSVQVPYGVVDTEGDRLVRIREKPTERLLINAGIYVIGPDSLPMVPDDRAFPITELVHRCLEGGLPVGVHPIEDEWTDVGLPTELNKARGHR
jgi:dTDP-glucose pyrophosphorylase